MRCRSCNAAIDLAAGERVGFRDCCHSCGADLHICLNCEFHDPTAYNECRESSAERVGDPERANRCEWFRPGDQAGGDGKAGLADLEALFKKS
jgi:hypothetical protein